MGVRRVLWIILLVLFSCILWKCWYLKVHHVKNIEIKIQNQQYRPVLNSKKNKRFLHIKSDVIDFTVDLYSGEICESRLLKYHSTSQSFQKLKLLNCNNHHYEIMSGIINNHNDIFKNKKQFFYTTSHCNFLLLNGQKILFVPIVSIKSNGIRIVKTFIIQKGSYNIGIDYKICNFNKYSSSCSIFGAVKKSFYIKKSIFHIYKNALTNQFSNIAYSNCDKKYHKLSFSDLKKHHNFYLNSHYSWISIFQKYFSISWILNTCDKHIVYTHLNNSNALTVGYILKCTIPSYSSKIIRVNLWMGPNIPYKMKLVAPNFDLIIDYGWFGFISRPLFCFLKILNLLFNNWGYSIIFITIIMRIITYPLLKSQYISSIKLKILHPKINEIKQKFKDNKKKINSETLNLYKKYQVNPFSGLIPVLIQMPIFIALYYMLVNTIDLRHASFIFWIHDLSDRDPYYVLPVFMALTIFFMQKTAVVRSLPKFINLKFMYLIPVFCVFFFLWFPSGLLLYYSFSNIMTALQQLFIQYNIKKNKKYKFLNE
ncbi:membrane protein insertase YidC [Buchnera aphidicola]|uniref:membrane protein insertase YidC n=1 Tax=Buchnera aphidicola TaxID=9 RepID=UPI003463B949